jgi:hypothetical protein
MPRSLGFEKTVMNLGNGSADLQYPANTIRVTSPQKTIIIPLRESTLFSIPKSIHQVTNIRYYSHNGVLTPKWFMASNHLGKASN